MNIFDKVMAMVSGVINKLLSNQKGDQEQRARQFIDKQKQSQSRLKQSMTELIFQRKKIEARLNHLESQRVNLKQDIESAALRDRDELAMNLMQEFDMVIYEIKENETNLEAVKKEISTAKEVEIELSRQIEKSQSQLAILMSRSQSIRMREDLHSQFSKIKKEVTNVRPGLNEIEENIMHLEARLENIQEPEEDWKNEVIEMRKERVDHQRRSRLDELKTRLKSRSLPGRVMVPEIIRQTH